VASLACGVTGFPGRAEDVCPRLRGAFVGHVAAQHAEVRGAQVRRVLADEGVGDGEARFAQVLAGAFACAGGGRDAREDDLQFASRAALAVQVVGDGQGGFQFEGADAAGDEDGVGAFGQVAQFLAFRSAFRVDDEGVQFAQGFGADLVGFQHRERQARTAPGPADAGADAAVLVHEGHAQPAFREGPARWTARVLFPTPPFSDVMAMTADMPSG